MRPPEPAGEDRPQLPAGRAARARNPGRRARGDPAGAARGPRRSGRHGCLWRQASCRGR